MALWERRICAIFCTIIALKLGTTYLKQIPHFEHETEHPEFLAKAKNAEFSAEQHICVQILAFAYNHLYIPLETLVIYQVGGIYTIYLKLI